MSDTTEKILLEVRLDVSKLTASAENARANIARLKEEQEKLTASGQKGTLQYQQNAQSISQYTKQLNEATKALAINDNLSRGNTGTLAEKRKAIIALTTAYAQYTEEEQRSNENAIDTHAQLVELIDDVKAQEIAYGNASRNVGNYTKSLNPLTREVSALRSEHKDLRNVMQGGLAIFSLLNIATGDGEKVTELQKNAMIGLVAVQAASEVRLGITAALKTADNLLTIKQVESTEALTTATEGQTLASGLWAKALTLSKTLLKAVGVESEATANILRGVLISSGIGLVIIAIGELIANWDKVRVALGGFTEEQKVNNEVSAKAADIFALEKVKVDALFSSARDLNLTTTERKSAIEELRSSYPGYLKNLNDENVLTDQGAKLQDKLSQALLLKAKIQGAQAIIADNEKKILEDQVKNQEQVATTAAQVIKNIFLAGGTFLGYAGSILATSKETEKLNKQNTFLLDFTKQLNDQLSNLGGDPSKNLFSRQLTDAKALADARLLLTAEGSKEELIAKIKDLEAQRNIELAETNKTAAEKYLIEVKFEKEVAKLRQDFLTNEYKKHEDLANEIYSAGIAQNLQRIKDANDAKKALYDLDDANVGASVRNQLNAMSQLVKERAEKDPTIKEKHEAELQLTEQFSASLFQINQNFLDSRIQQIEAEEKAGKISKERAAKEIAAIKRKEAIAAKEEALFNIAINLPESITKLEAQLGIGAAVAIPLAVALAAAQAAAVISKPIPAFASGGLTGKRISSNDGVAIRRNNGDDILATVKAGEVILNQAQQNMLGGAAMFRRIGVPGFAEGGIPGFNDGGFAARAVSQPVINSLQTQNLENLMQQFLDHPTILRISDLHYVEGKVAEVTANRTV